jgi:Fur family peroxide stress response transcriptional regulator
MYQEEKMRGRAINRAEIKTKLLAGLKEKGLKLTKQRKLIVDILASDRTHPDAQAIYDQARKKMPSLGLSTVYYTLNELKQLKLLREIEFYEMNNRYDINTNEHVNLICRNCRSIMDYHEEPLVSRDIVRKETGFSVEDMRLEYYGLCKTCRKE